MNFETATKKEINTLIEKYNKIKQRCSLDLTARENNVKTLVQEQKTNNLATAVLIQYLTQEIKPLLDFFEEPDKEVVKQYFRFISGSKTITPGFKFR